MSMSRLSTLALAVALGGCSYGYDLKAVVINGRLAFIVDPQAQHDVRCFNQIDVVATGNARAKPSPGDDVSRVSYGTFWHQRLDYDCADEFPVLYGQPLKGKPLSLGQGGGAVGAKALRIGVVYEVSTTTGATGYGDGAFKILPDHRVINVPPPALGDAADQSNVTSANVR